MSITSQVLEDKLRWERARLVEAIVAIDRVTISINNRAKILARRNTTQAREYMHGTIANFIEHVEALARGAEEHAKEVSRIEQKLYGGNQ